ncbi:hypothetical protein DMC01_01905 [Campylobacter troglodytis]|nr:hypothetical protein DMC01_01905 [Campylobacter troglodytis]
MLSKKQQEYHITSFLILEKFKAWKIKSFLSLMWQILMLFYGKFFLKFEAFSKKYCFVILSL